MIYENGILNLRGEEITDISQIKEYKYYKDAIKIDLSRNLIEDISGLADLELENLKYLCLEGNRISKIEGLQNLTNLKSVNFGEPEDLFWDKGEWGELAPYNLCLYRGPPLRGHGEGNKIKEISGLDNLANLRYLTLSFNEITEIKGLENLKKLKDLDLSFNYITEIKGLDNQKELLSLNLCYNKISGIKGLDNLGVLQKLDLYHNAISEVKGIKHLENLGYLFIGHNNIKEIKKSELPSLIFRFFDTYFLKYLENENIKLS